MQSIYKGKHAETILTKNNFVEKLATKAHDTTVVREFWGFLK